jgi:hypothetical protein
VLHFRFEAAQHPGIFDRLDKIRRFRNRLAHSHVNLEKGAIDRVTLEFHENGELKSQVVLAAEFRERLAECTKTVEVLLQLQNIVAK